MKQLSILVFVASLVALASTYGNEGLQTKFFDQIVDHFSRDTTTFKQRYFVNADYFLAGGPISIYISGKLDSFTLLHQGEMFDGNREVNGILFGLEHRYFGASQPVPDTRVEHLQYLTPLQAVADIANFIAYIRETYPSVASSKVILFGEGYGATLAVWAKQKLPNLVTGVWGSSADLKLDLGDDQHAVSLANVFKRVGGSKCYDTFKYAIETLNLLVWTREEFQIETDFKLCKSPKTDDAFDTSALFANILQYLSNQVGTLMYEEIDEACQFFADGDASNYEKFTSWWREILFPNVQCFNFNAEDMIEVFKESSWETVGTAGGDRQNLYLKCSGLGQFPTSSGPAWEQPFPDVFPLDYYKRVCDEVFGEGFTKTLEFENKKLKAYFGGLEIGDFNGFYITNGEFDPKISLGLTNVLLEKSRATTIPFVTRSKDIQPMPEGKDYPYLQAVKNRAKWMILWWINGFRPMEPPISE